MEAAGTASERVEAAESAAAAWAAAVALTRTEAASGQSPEGTTTAWVGASMGEASGAAVGVVVGVAVGVEAQVTGMAAAAMGTTEAGTMGWATRTREAKGVAATEGP